MYFRALLILLAGLGTVSGFATTFLERPFPEAIEDAPYIVRGVVGGSASDWSGSKEKQQLYTFYDLQVSEVFKGTIADRNISIRELGGERDGIGMQVAGAARFSRGEDVLVLLGTRNSDGSFPVRGMMTGRYDIVHDEKDNSEYLVGAGLGASGREHRHDLDGHEEDSGDQAGPSERFTLEDLRDLIREQAEDQKNSINSNGTAEDDSSPRSQTSGEQAAPQLQTSPSDSSLAAEDLEDKTGIPGWLAITLGGLGALAVVAFLVVKSRR